jgi:hypothetical protein
MGRPTAHAFKKQFLAVSPALRVAACALALAPPNPERRGPRPRRTLRAVADWVTISALATGGGTLVLAVATFGSVRSANRAARVAERSMLVSLRPLLVPSRLLDPPEKIHFVDGRWIVAPGGGAAAEAGEDAVYLGLALRNVGSGIALLHGWCFHAGRAHGDGSHPPLERFRRLTRDLYVPAGETGFWQGAFRDPATDEFGAARAAVEAREPMTIDLLYGDYEGGQRMISRFGVLPREDGTWTAAASRHWNIDRADPR